MKAAKHGGISFTLFPFRDKALKSGEYFTKGDSVNSIQVNSNTLREGKLELLDSCIDPLYRVFSDRAKGHTLPVLDAQDSGRGVPKYSRTCPPRFRMDLCVNSNTWTIETIHGRGHTVTLGASNQHAECIIFDFPIK